MKEIKFNFPKELIMSILTNNNDAEVIIDNKDFYEDVYSKIKMLDKKNTSFALIRIKLYKNPMSLKDTAISAAGIIATYIVFPFKKYTVTLVLLILFYTAVFLTWYFSNRRKVYICEVMKFLLSQRLDELETNENTNDRKKKQKIYRKF